ncbi:hypothetical protein [[Kitasatospora] papulosa]|uniref:hypothetical protein n=1 Tax=[Kitasatospora] papulosa TaxID=1464011 RepID=UPI0036C1C258
MSAFDQYLVGYGPERVHEVTIHNRENGGAVIETVTSKPLLVFEKQADGSLVELHGDAKDRALEAFWADVETFNSNGENL